MALQISEPYKKYMIVWMDILGFKNRVRKSSNNQDEILAIKIALQTANNLALLLRQSTKLAVIDVGVFSDTILIACPKPDIMTASGAIIISSLYQVVMAKQCHFIRGAAVIGAHYSEGTSIVFGPALIKAQDLEKIAVWPRIVIDPELKAQIEPIAVEKIKEIAGVTGMSLSFSDTGKLNSELINDFAKAFFKPSNDGISYVDYLRCALDTLMPMKWALELSKEQVDPLVMQILQMDLLPAHRDSILKALKSNEVKDNIDVLTKYHALAQYHNDAVDTLYTTLSNVPDTVDEMMEIFDFSFMWGFLSTMLLSVKVDMAKNQSKNLVNSKLKEMAKLKDALKECTIELPKEFPELYT